MQTSKPVCFLCHKPATLVFHTTYVKCEVSRGGCGHAFEVEEIPYLYDPTIGRDLSPYDESFED